MIGLLLVILLIIGLTIGVIILQVKLSKSPSKWLGLMPSITIFLFSLIVVLGLVAFTSQLNTSTTNGEGIETYTDDVADGYVVMLTEQTKIQVFLHIITVLITFNWPILILLSIHFVIRNKRSRRNEFDRMNIQDL